TQSCALGRWVWNGMRQAPSAEMRERRKVRAGRTRIPVEDESIPSPEGYTPPHRPGSSCSPQYPGLRPKGLASIPRSSPTQMAPYSPELDPIGTTPAVPTRSSFPALCRGRCPSIHGSVTITAPLNELGVTGWTKDLREIATPCACWAAENHAALTFLSRL